MNRGVHTVLKKNRILGVCVTVHGTMVRLKCARQILWGFLHERNTCVILWPAGSFIRVYVWFGIGRISNVCCHFPGCDVNNVSIFVCPSTNLILCHKRIEIGYECFERRFDHRGSLEKDQNKQLDFSLVYSSEKLIKSSLSLWNRLSIIWISFTVASMQTSDAFDELFFFTNARMMSFETNCWNDAKQEVLLMCLFDFFILQVGRLSRLAPFQLWSCRKRWCWSHCLHVSKFSQ